MACHQCQIPLLDRKSHLAVKATQLLNLFAFRREEGEKLWVFQKVCTSARSLSRTQSRTGKQIISFSRPKEAFFAVAEKSVFFELKENADIGSFSCLCRQEQDECK